MGKKGRKIAEKQAIVGGKTEKYGRNQLKVAETEQETQKNYEMRRFFPISVLPSSHFCPAKHINFFKGEPRPPRPPPPAMPMFPNIVFHFHWIVET